MGTYRRDGTYGYHRQALQVIESADDPDCFWWAARAKVAGSYAHLCMRDGSTDGFADRARRYVRAGLYLPVALFRP